jgi:hypothetical protein
MESLWNLLKYLENGDPISDAIQTLLIHSWRSVRFYELSSGLANLCDRYKVRKLVYSNVELNSNDVHLYLKRLKSHVVSDVPFLHHLREIEIAYDVGNIRPQQTIVSNSRVTSIKWTIDSLTDQGDKIIRVMNLFANRGYCDEFRLREIHFSYNRIYEGLNVSIERDNNLLCEEKNDVLLMLERNRNAFKKCQEATTTLLGLKRRREHRMYRDVWSLVVAVVWSTRGTKIWIG